MERLGAYRRDIHGGAFLCSPILYRHRLYGEGNEQRGLLHWALRRRMDVVFKCGGTIVVSHWVCDERQPPHRLLRQWNKPAHVYQILVTSRLGRLGRSRWICEGAAVSDDMESDHGSKKNRRVFLAYSHEQRPTEDMGWMEMAQVGRSGWLLCLQSRMCDDWSRQNPLLRCQL